MDSRFFLVLMLGAACGMSVQGSAGLGLFSKKPAKNPSERVPELIQILKTSGDENKRADAAAELRQFEVTTFPDIVPTLVISLSNDAKPSVRAEAAASLGKIRPVNVAVGQALEKAIAQDNSMRVRIQARSSLLQYNLAGYRSPGKSSSIEGKEPPLAEPSRALPVPKTVPVTAPLGKKAPAVDEPGSNPFFPIPNLFKPKPVNPAAGKEKNSGIKGKQEGPDLFPK